MIARIINSDIPPWLKQRSLPSCDRVCMLLSLADPSA